MTDIYRIGQTFQHPEDFRAFSDEEQGVIDTFLRFMWQRWTHARPGGEGPISVGWLGYLAQKSPLDLWVYQEIICELKPQLIIETGTCLGGSGLFLATICDLIGSGQVVSIDIVDQPGRPVHPRLEYIMASSTDPDVVADLRRRAAGLQSVLVILDSDHSCRHVLDEMSAYADLVTPGSYLIVEDTIVNNNPVEPDFGPGPAEAVDLFIQQNPGIFEIDRSRERFMMSLNRKGFLKRL